MAFLEDVIQDTLVVSSSDLSAKSVTLSRTPDSTSDVALNAIAGTSQKYGADYTVSGKTVSWNGLGMDGVVIEGEKLRAVYVTEGSINVFGTYPQRDGSNYLSTINAEALIPLTEADDYFDDIAKVARVDVRYVHEDGRQSETVIHYGPNLTGNGHWTTLARSGEWHKQSAWLKDTDGAEITIGRGIIGTRQDLTLP